MTERGSLHVVLVSPEGQRGGITQWVSLVREAYGAPITILDPRGTGGIWNSVPRTLVSLYALIRLRHVDVLHVNLSDRASALRKSIFLYVAKRRKIPTVTHVHAVSLEGFLERHRWVIAPFVRRAVQSSAAVLVLGEHFVPLATHHLGVDVARVHVLMNAVAGPNELGAPSPHEDLELLVMGRLGRRKGTDDLLAALDALPDDVDFRLTMAGDRDPHWSDKALATSRHAARIATPGWCTQDELVPLLRRADVVILPSHAEGMPMALLEAQAYGLPVIATNVGAVADVVNDEVGVLIEAGDVVALTDAIVRLARDADLRQKMSLAARTKWRAHHQIADYVVKLEALWVSISRTSASS